MKLALVIFVVALISSAVATKPAPGPLFTVQDFEQLLLGVAEGLEVEIGNVTECTKDVNITRADFTQSFIDLDDGIKHVSISEIDQGLREFGAGVNEIAVALDACGVDTLAYDIKTIAQELESGPDGIVKVIVKEVVNIFHNGKDLTSDFKEAIADWQSGNYQGAGVNIGEILGILLQD